MINFKKITSYLPLSLILISAFILRLIAILKYGDFWWDEMFSFVYSQKPLTESVKLWLLETNPPLHLFLLKIWFFIFPANEFFARFLSLIFGVLSIWLIYTLGKKFFSERLGLIAAGLLAITPYHIFLSATARGYVLLVFLAILSLHYFYSIFFLNKLDKKKFFYFGLINLLLIYCHLTAWLLLLGQIIILALYYKTTLKTWLKINFLPLILWLIWAIPAFYLKLNGEFIKNSWFFQPSITWPEKFSALELLFFGPNFYWHTAILITIFILLTAKIIFNQTREKNIDKSFIALLILFFTPLIFTCGLGFWHIKYIIIVLPILILLTAYLLNYYFSSRLILFLTTLLIVIPGLIFFFSSLPLNDWQPINNYLDNHYQPNKKQIFIYDNFVYKFAADRYLKTPMPQSGYYLGNNWDYDVITKNHYVCKHNDQEITDWLLANKITGYDEIFLLQDYKLNPSDIPVNLGKTIEENGYRLTDEINTTLTDKKSLRYYTK